MAMYDRYRREDRSAFRYLLPFPPKIPTGIPACRQALCSPKLLLFSAQALPYPAVRSWRFVSFGRSFNFQNELCFNPSICLERGRVLNPHFLKNIFCKNKKRAETPDKQGVFGSKNFFEIFYFS